MDCERDAVVFFAGAWLLILMGFLGIVALVAAGMGGVVALRFVDNMTQTPVIATGERVFGMPTGVVARGGTLILPREQRELAAKLPNPLKTTPDSVAVGKERYVTFCAPCHGPEAKGGVTGPVATKFVPPPDLTKLTEAEKDAAGRFLPGLVIARIPLFLFQAVQAALLPKLSALAGAGLHGSFRKGLWRLLAVEV